MNVTAKGVQIPYQTGDNVKTDFGEKAMTKRQVSRKLTNGTGNSGNATPPTAPTGTARKTLKCGARI